MGNAHTHNDDENDPTNSTAQPLPPPSVLSGLDVAAMCKIVTQPINDEDRQLIHTMKQHITNHGGAQVILQRSVSDNEVNNSEVPVDDRKMEATSSRAPMFPMVCPGERLFDANQSITNRCTYCSGDCLWAGTGINRTEEELEKSKRKRRGRREARATKRAQEKKLPHNRYGPSGVKHIDYVREDEFVDPSMYCTGCGRFQRKSMKKCTGCDWAMFCTEDCYAEHWPAHHETCQIMKKNRRACLELQKL